MEKRKLTSADIDRVRDIEGFPIGTDADIIALSDAPYYTACPNPFIEDFIKENGHPYNEETDDYHCEPFASDVSEGKSDPIYIAHSYHTKVPYKAIMKYILHYTKPGDVVFDGFCGTGMTGVAAQMCGAQANGQWSNADNDEGVWGYRKAVLTDLSPMASYLSRQYNRSTNPTEIAKIAEDLIRNCEEKCGWLYEVTHTVNGKVQNDLSGKPIIGRMNCVIWSDALICPSCSEEFVLWDVALDSEKGSVKDEFKCPRCGCALKKKDCAHAQTTYYDDLIGENVTTIKQVPVLVNYSVGTKRYQRRPIQSDLDLIEKINTTPIPNWVPTDRMTEGSESRRNDKFGMTHVHHFYTRRNLFTLSYAYEAMQHHRVNMEFTSLLARCTRLNRVMIGYFFNGGGGWVGGNLSGTLYMPSFSVEVNALSTFASKLKKYVSWKYDGENTIVSCQSSSKLETIPDNSIDYIFTDPPFGANLNYSELSFLWEAWLKVKTNNKCEAIMNDVQGKGLVEYQQLMTECFSEFYRILKPNRWMTVEFHNSKNAVWNAIQESLQRSGFVIADVRTLDKKQGSFKQVNNTSAVKQDLVISAYKPMESFAKEFKIKAGTDKTAWSFVRQHLSNVPVVVKRGGQIEVIAERQAFLLWDRMVAYHIMNGIAVPMDAPDFYKGLDEHFLKRDGMYFLPSQVNKYDKVRATCDVESIQFSLFVSDEKTAIGWLYQQLDATQGEGPQTYAELMPKFMQELKAVDKREKMPELMVILEENFLKDKDGKWYIPDYTKSGDIAKLREKNLWKEFQEYQQSKGKLKQFRSEAIRVGFARLWKEKNYAAIVAMAERLPEETIQEDQNLLMYYDISLSRV